ncbi:MAG: hypothetical protein K8T26_04345 [Lentisphaerae bacterium]|nr:hypothetical protein [Lentisphaerota bacterium]
MERSTRWRLLLLAGCGFAATAAAGDPPSFDAFRPGDTQVVSVSLGTIELSPGPHTFTFRVIDRNPSSRGYRVGIDTLTVSPCGLAREAEAQLPAIDRWGPALSGYFVDTNLLSGTRALSFPATAPDQFFSLAMENDRWEESNFAEGEGQHDHTVRTTVLTNTARDSVIQLVGQYNVNWRVTDQIGNSNRLSSAKDRYRGCAVRVVIRGRNAEGGGHIRIPSGAVWAYFMPGSGGMLRINHAFIAEALVSNGVVTADTVPGSAVRLKTGSGENSLTLPASTPAYMGYPARMEIDPERSYAVTYLMDSAVNYGNLAEWRGTNPLDHVGAYVIPLSSAPTLQTVTSDTWSARSDVIATNVLPGVELLWGTYATNGVYTSRIVDTQTPAPVFTTIDWHARIPSNNSAVSRLRILARSGNAEMSDAPDWAMIPPMTNPGALNLPRSRYVQFQVWMQSPSNWFDMTPQLSDLTLAWTGTTQVVELSGRFLTGPDFGIWELLVDTPPPPPRAAPLLIVR